MRLKAYDPVYYIASEKMPFTIRVEVNLKDTVEPEALVYAVNTAIKRYPYFSVRVTRKDGVLCDEPNELPVVVYSGEKVYPLGGSEVNHHLLALSYHNNTVNFFVSHIITDGCGFFPFIKTVLYYYLCRRHSVGLDPSGIRLADEPFYPDELGDPFPEDIRNAEPLYIPKPSKSLSLAKHGYVGDEKMTMFRLRLDEAEVMRFNHDNDGSPCVLFSSLMAKAVWNLHPEINEDVVSAVSFNLRPGLKNRYSYRMLCNALMLKYTERMKSKSITELCTCSRGMITLQSQSENVRWYAKQRCELIEKANLLPDEGSKSIFFSDLALKDSVDNTFSISYVGKMGLGSLEPYIDSIYNATDGSTYKTVFIEVNAVNGCFDVAFLQGFSSDIYYRAFTKQLSECGLSFTEEGKSEMNTPGFALP